MTTNQKDMFTVAGIIILVTFLSIAAYNYFTEPIMKICTVVASITVIVHIVHVLFKQLKD